MKTFDSGILTALSQEQSALFYLIELEFADSYYYTNCDIDLAFGGNTYQAKWLEVGNIETSSDMGVDSVDVELDNSLLDMGSIVLGEDISGLPVVLSLCAISMEASTSQGILYDTAGTPMEDTVPEYLTDTTGTTTNYFHPIAVEPLFRGLVNNWNLIENKLRLGLVNEIALWNKRTLRPASASCPWEVNGTECTLSDASCDQSYSRCAALGNTANFGGHRFLPGIMETSVWWGRSPK